ncbi:MAG: ZPR1 zinc finger domain-containing protein [Methanobacterium sp. ERen5]|nr:MAG: ZPR1 zinc finger domain-containing protein [Methanobacterium sp. ERen5]
MNNINTDCPVCKGRNTLEMTSKTEEIPYFGEILESTIICSECGYRHTDTICLEQKEPVYYSLLISKANINARVVKSQTATLSIPDLGLKVEPGPKSQGYVSNVEGVLNRFGSAVETAIEWAEEPEVKENALKIIEKIEDIKSGDGSATLIIEDPFGHSIIIHDDAKHRKLSQEEVENLNTGFVTIDQ